MIKMWKAHGAEYGLSDRLCDMIRPKGTNVRSEKGREIMTKEEAKKLIASLSREDKEQLLQLARYLASRKVCKCKEKKVG